MPATMTASTLALHGQPYQINQRTLDRNSTITGRGTHKRCIVFRDPARAMIEVRVDAVVTDPALPWPTEAQIRRVALDPAHRLHAKGVMLTYLGEDAEAAGDARLGITESRWYRFAERR